MKKPLTIIIIFYFFTRLINLTLLPVFSDESLYMQWGWQAMDIPERAWFSLTDAKQPFLIWLFGIGQSIFPDPLFGARLISVFTGMISVLGFYYIGKNFFDKKVAVLCSILYILSPIFLFFDRQALMESAITASAVWSLYFLLKLLDSQKFKYAILLGLSLGLGFFTKNSALIFLITSLLIINLKIIQNRNLFHSLSLFQLTVVFVFILINLPLFFQGLYWETLSTNSRWTFTLSELVQFPIHQWAKNLVGNTQIAFIFLTPLIFFFALIGIHSTLKAKGYQLKAILLWFLFSTILYLLSLRFMNFMSMRYLAPFLPPLVIFSAYKLSQKPKMLTGLVLVIPAAYSLLLLFNPIAFFRLDSKINKYSYIESYVTGYDTGYQVNAVVNYFHQLAKNENIIVTTAVHSFNPESGIWNYLRKNPRIQVAYLDSLIMSGLDRIDCLKSKLPTYFVAKLDDTAGLDKYLDRVTVITNPYNPDYSTIYKLKKDCTGTSATLNLTKN